MYEDLGEKPSNYFFNLENRNYDNKVMNKLINEKGEELYETKDILGCQKYIVAFILRSINYGYRNGYLSITQKQWLITCLPKPNKS